MKSKSIFVVNNCLYHIRRLFMAFRIWFKGCWHFVSVLLCLTAQPKDYNLEVCAQ